MPPPTNLFGGFQVTPNASKNTTAQPSCEIEDRTSNKIVTPATITKSSTKDTSGLLFSNKKFQIYGFTGELFFFLKTFLAFNFIFLNLRR